jgi:septum formation protein
VRLVLASASPRRRELLARLGFDFEVVPPAVDEASVIAGRPVDLARSLARLKAQDVADAERDAIVLAADTVVVEQRRTFAKPADADEARRMLSQLRGKDHNVITAVAVLRPGRLRPAIEHVITHVRMRAYSAAEVEASIARGDPFDKAGGYAIQDPMFAPVASYEGCYCNVVGMPLWTTLRLLSQAGVEPGGEPDMPAECRDCPLKEEVTK